ncbi:MAG: branched-chain amino acid ABC transporter permease [Rhodospirillaceae bacterium]|jgi:branched-chain amino acid transport system permease protein|nr:branched-chain amino acid ABC transporter permease [Rhodospirillaceae bacterium]MBT5245311.1 branched-chain amino acid ABC transporter permease [Rhodospirillaceae bacterium]MBT5561427.1 branched-chain amino acid ABC transporter permease [Rhodospirillaceae bacterium]MBT6243320.1 branched-chain amino acid ABC transporter permease [Rhodospirillaceae bacterium]MBT7137177.1 branched-chain amino acid ABC transporter permease [Rhodospirillaceae bacterium]
MNNTRRSILSFSVMAGLLLIVGQSQSWPLMLTILNLCLISSVMALGVNIQWGYAGLFNVGTMGFAALGGVAAMLVSKAPIPEAWAAGGSNLFIGVVLFLFTLGAAVAAYRKIPKGSLRVIALSVIILIGIFATRYFSDTAIADIEAVNPALTGYLGGLGLPILFSWAAGGLLAAGGAWIVGKIALGLRSDYLAIATLGISEIIIAVLKNEDWLTRGVKNVAGLPRPVPYEIDLQKSDSFISWIEWLNSGALKGLSDSGRADQLSAFVIEQSGIFVKLCYAGLFTTVLLLILSMSVMALNSPWGRMMRAIRDNEVSAAAMGKNITGRHLQVFVIGSAVVGIAGAMLTTLDGQLTPAAYNPLRFTFLIWVMVIVGGSGNNLGSVLGGFLIWFIWIEAEPVGVWLMDFGTSWMDEGNPVRLHLMDSAQHMRLFMMGMVLLLVMRFNPGGILPEVTKPGLNK